MPKYSLPKKMLQLDKNNEVKVYKYHTEFSQAKDALTYKNHSNNYWTQYKRTHDYLGALRGTGEPKEYPSRSSYNIFTGKILNFKQIFVKNCYNKKKIFIQVKPCLNQVGV